MRADRHQKILLVLLIDPLAIHRSPALRTTVRQRHIDLLIHMIRHRPVRMPAMLNAATASRAARALPRIALRERRRLTLPRPTRLLKLGPQPLDVRAQTRVLRPQPANPHTTTHINPIVAHTPNPHPTTNARIPARRPPTHTPATFAAARHTPSRRVRRPLTHYLRPRSGMVAFAIAGHEPPGKSKRAPQCLRPRGRVRGIHKPALDEDVTLRVLARECVSGDQQAPGRPLLQRRCGRLASFDPTAGSRRKPRSAFAGNE